MSTTEPVPPMGEVPTGPVLPASWPAPAWLAEQAQRFRASGASPAAPRVAATVVLLRPGSDPGFEVYAIRRAATMAFAANMYAFPGGRVDPRDADAEVAWVGPPPSAWAVRFGTGAPEARAVVAAAVRELFEECGVLLAGPTPATVVGDVSGDEWEVARQALEARTLSLTDLLASRGLALRADLLTPWARWLTPESEPRRYDTYFFLARLPEGQLTRDVGGEAAHTVWLAPARSAGLPMLPPTSYTLSQLAAYPDVDSALAAAAGHDLTTAVMPRIEFDQDGAGRIVLVGEE